MKTIKLADEIVEIITPQGIVRVYPQPNHNYPNTMIFVSRNDGVHFEYPSYHPSQDQKGYTLSIVSNAREGEGTPDCAKCIVRGICANEGAYKGLPEDWCENSRLC